MTVGDEALGISDREYEERWSKLQRAMERNGCDLLFVYGDDRSFSGPALIRYLSDYAAHFEPALIVMPKEGKPVLLTGPELKEYAVACSRIKDVSAVYEFALAGQEYPYVEMTDLPTAVREAVGGGTEHLRRLGVAGLGVISASILESLKTLFSRASFTDAGPWLTEIRMLKSGGEIELIKRAYELADVGLDACMRSIRDGVSEHEVAAEGEYAMRRMGSERTGMDTVVSSGPHTRLIIARTTDRRIGQGDLVSISIGPRFHGYHGQLGRPIFFGARAPKVLDFAMKIAREALEMTREALKPGAAGEEVEAAGRNHVKKAGLGEYYTYSSCHSVGTAEAEEPVLGPGSRLIVRPNMVFSIDIPLFLAPFGGFRHEDGFLVTESGCVRLNKTSLGPFFVT